jgi:hypothetical protein
MNIPAMALFANATNEHEVQLVNINPPIQDLELNLSMYVRVIERSLPSHQEVGVDDDEEAEEEEEEEEEEEDQE